MVWNMKAIAKLVVIVTVASVMSRAYVTVRDWYDEAQLKEQYETSWMQCSVELRSCRAELTQMKTELERMNAIYDDLQTRAMLAERENAKLASELAAIRAKYTKLQNAPPPPNDAAEAITWLIEHAPRRWQ